MSVSLRVISMKALVGEKETMSRRGGGRVHRLEYVVRQLFSEDGRGGVEWDGDRDRDEG